MPSVTLRAHFDGERIVLDEPFDLPLNSPLIVTLLPSEGDERNLREEWAILSVRNLAEAYSSAEPDYTEADIKQP